MRPIVSWNQGNWEHSGPVSEPHRPWPNWRAQRQFLKRCFRRIPYVSQIPLMRSLVSLLWARMGNCAYSCRLNRYTIPGDSPLPVKPRMQKCHLFLIPFTRYVFALRQVSAIQSWYGYLQRESPTYVGHYDMHVWHERGRCISWWWWGLN